MTSTRVLDGLVIAGLVLFPMLAPGYLDLGTRVVILVLCAMSLDLLVGYCGLVTLGHAAFFGVGAYAAGIFALRASAEPVLGLLAGGAAAAVLGPTPDTIAFYRLIGFVLRGYVRDRSFYLPSR